MGRFRPFQFQGGVSVEQDVDGIAGLHRSAMETLQMALGGTINELQPNEQRSLEKCEGTTGGRTHNQRNPSSPFQKFAHKITLELFALKKQTLEKKQVTDLIWRNDNIPT
jgi:hypothetical protein